MTRNWTSGLLAAVALFTFAAPASAATIRVSMENLAPEGGVWFTQSSVFFHDGGFDIFNLGDPASVALERTAEDALRTVAEGSPDPGLLDVFATYASSRPGAQGVAFNGPSLVSPAPGVVFHDFAPGASASQTYELDPSNPNNRYFSFAWMMIPSNDAFYANDDPLVHRLFDDAGNFLGVDLIVFGSDILDAGTEVNDEARPTTAFLAQMMPDTGTTEGGVVTNHPGYNPPNGVFEDGGVLDDPRFFNALFDSSTYQIARIRVELVEVPEPATTGLLAFGSLAAFAGAAVRRRRSIG